MPAASDPSRLLPAPTTPESADPSSDTGIDEVVARFIVWLARQDVPADRRRRYHRHVDRYLRWCAADPYADRTHRRYYNQLERHGYSENDLTDARTALALLTRHLTLTRRMNWTRTSSPHA